MQSSRRATGRHASHQNAAAHKTYDRHRDLPRLLPLWPDELASEDLAARAVLVSRLAALLRRERQRGLAGDWSYDLARHRQLVVAYKAEWHLWKRTSVQTAARTAAAGLDTPEHR